MRRFAAGFAFVALLLFFIQPAHAVSVCIPSCTPVMRAQMTGAFSGTPTLDFGAEFPGCAIPVVDSKYSMPIGGGPVKFDALLSKYADGYDLGDKKVVLKSIMLLESNANPTDFGPNPGSYDIGLMQVNNKYVGPYWQGYSFPRDPDFSSPKSAWCPQTNIQMGVEEFSRCLKDHQNDDREALCCYNTGHGCANNDNGFKYLAAYSNALVRVYGYGS